MKTFAFLSCVQIWLLVPHRLGGEFMWAGSCWIGAWLCSSEYGWAPTSWVPERQVLGHQCANNQVQGKLPQAIVDGFEWPPSTTKKRDPPHQSQQVGYQKFQPGTAEGGGPQKAPQKKGGTDKKLLVLSKWLKLCERLSWKIKAGGAVRMYWVRDKDFLTSLLPPPPHHHRLDGGRKWKDTNEA